MFTYALFDLHEVQVIGYKPKGYSLLCGHWCCVLVSQVIVTEVLLFAHVQLECLECCRKQIQQMECIGCNYGWA